MRKVWIIDDDEEMNRAVGLMLKMLNCEVRTFQSARSAVQTLLTGKTPEMLILDINMPEVSGLDMLEFLRRRKEWKELPIIMLSSEAADSTVDKALQMGADSYLIKPVTIEELEKSMATAIDKHMSIK
ncbi:MAG: response regulator [Chloroflexi bacterium]|jgi:two-component system chemotaxis response regulator CheY|nr:MAG: response regulator [Chloroflexota bacterium]